jgi:hypothetical protein
MGTVLHGGFQQRRVAVRRQQGRTEAQQASDMQQGVSQGWAHCAEHSEVAFNMLQSGCHAA